jgi:FkbM family methyltransferase
VGSDRFSRPARSDIDRKLERYLPYREGFFIEVGANDGFAQSNTYYLEKVKGWTGILIEPVPVLHERCVKERARSAVFNCALVSSDYDGDSVTMLYADLMSLVRGAQGSRAGDLEYVRRGMEIQGYVQEPFEITVPARTLTSILDEVEAQDIDLLSLDVEGYELNVLHGLDLRRYPPAYILVEANYPDEIENHLSVRGYEMVDTFSCHDVLYRRK